jgi:hypothetical protein
MSQALHIFLPLDLLWSALSIRDYLREKAAESRHDEMSAYLMFIAGSVLYVGGVLETLLVAEGVNWLLCVPVSLSGAPGCLFGLALTLSGLALMVFGLIAGTYFARDRGWYMSELKNASIVDEKVVARKKRRTSVNNNSK